MDDRAKQGKEKQGRLNDGLYRAHRMLLILYSLVGGILLIAIAAAISTGDSVRIDNIVGLLAFTVFFALLVTVHAYGARGARLGAPWGRTLSRIVGCLMLPGIGIGTVVGIYILYETSDRRWRIEHPDPDD